MGLEGFLFEEGRQGYAHDDDDDDDDDDVIVECDCSFCY